MPTYMLILHETPATYADLSPAQMQAIVERYRAWSEELGRKGKLQGGEKLRDDGGQHLRRVRGALQVSDGPYAEAKDVIGGYFLLEATDTAEARSLASSCPHLDNGWIELREIEPT